MAYSPTGSQVPIRSCDPTISSVDFFLGARFVIFFGNTFVGVRCCPGCPISSASSIRRDGAGKEVLCSEQSCRSKRSLPAWEYAGA